MRGPSSTLVDKLRVEAKNLHYLLDMFLDDKRFVRSRRGVLLYFIDSHELKSYIAPEATLDGFLFLAEQHRRSASFDLELCLKSEQILHDLLFDDRRQTGLLPSHAEEIDDEIAFREDEWLQNRISLLDQARTQVQSILARHVTLSLDTAVGSPDRKRQIVEFFRRAAPAVIAVVRPNPESHLARIDALVGRSNLVRLDSLSWEKFGYENSDCTSLRALAPVPSVVNEWREFLAERRGNTYRSNRIDAEALAFLHRLNAYLATLPGPPVRALLVTRAMSLISGARNHGGADFLRHPRLLLLPSMGEARDDRSGATELQSEEALLVALGTYHRQLKAQARDPKQHNEREFEAARETLVSAWDAFERARITIDLRSGPILGRNLTSDEAIDTEFQGLLKWLRDDAEVEDVIAKELRREIGHFGQATFALGQGKGSEPVVAQIVPMSKPRRSRIIPLASGVPFLVELLAPGLRRLRPHYTDVTDVLSDLDANIAERYIAWAMLFACHKRWKLAEIYAKSAVHIAKLTILRERDANWARNEAELLLAQISRLSSPERHYGSLGGRVRARFDVCEKYLRENARKGDPRVPFERAAQLLELRLTVGDSDATVSLQNGFELLATAERLSARDEVVRSRVLALGVAYYVAARRDQSLWPEMSQTQAEVLREWHQHLHALLTEERKRFKRDEISRRARAMELLGFQWFDLSEEERYPVGSISERVRIPSELLLDVFEVFEEVRRASDATARFISKELEKVVLRLSPHRQRDLIYAPVWDSDENSRLVEVFAGSDVYDLVRDAYKKLRQIAGASQKLGVLPGDRDTLIELSKDFKTAARGVVIGELASSFQMRRGAYYLMMESCYVDLLLSRLEWPEPRRDILLRLVEDYKNISQVFPEASVPHFRLDVVLTALSRELRRGASTPADPDADELDQWAAREAQTALELVDEDPYLTPKHWVKSTMKRRLASRFGRRVELLRGRLNKDRLNEELRSEYVYSLVQAFEIVHENFSYELFPAADDLHALEARRRINNIVYYGTLLFEQSRSSESFGAFVLGRDQLHELLARLEPESTSEMTDLNIVHTIGYASSVLGDANLASRAGARALVLIDGSGIDTAGDDTSQVIADALRWVRPRAEELSMSA